MIPQSINTPEDDGQADDLFHLLVDRVVDYAIFALTPQGHVASWNVGAQRLKGYTADEIIGSSFERFYTPGDRADGRPQRLLAAARANGRVEDEGWRVRKDGSRFWANVVISAVRNDSGELVGYAKVTRDLTERRRSERERARRLAAERTAERMERLQAATAALAAACQPEGAAEVLAEVAVAMLGAISGVVAFPTADGAALEVICVRGGGPHPLRPQQVIRPDDPYPLAHAWRTGQPVFESSIDSAWAAVPLSVEQRLLGLVGLGFAGPCCLDTGERSLVLALAEVAAQAIDRARLYASEQRARAEAEAAVEARDEFLSIASHELRTPVAAVKVTAQLARRAIERGRLEATRIAHQLDGIAHAADRLSVLVDDLLDVSRLRTGDLQLRRQALDLATLVEEVVERQRVTADGHELNLDLDCGGCLVWIDPVRFEQVLENLLGNAIKYSPAGGRIDVELAPAEQGVRLAVTDRGIGLPEGQEQHIFEAFGRAPNAAEQQIPGMGLGLAISRQLVEAHGGRIWATSPGERQGATFSVWLPAATPSQIAATETEHG